MQEYTTSKDDQTKIPLWVYEEENLDATKNNLIGICVISVQLQKGEPSIMVSFDIDANGILNVSAWDQDDANVKGNIQIKTTADNLSPECIKRLIKKEERYRIEQRKILETDESRVKLEKYCFTMSNHELNENVANY